MASDAKLSKWDDEAPPSEPKLRALMTHAGLRPYSWSNAPFDEYAAHSHDYNKVIYVVRGSITFALPNDGLSMEMQAGDRLDLPAGTVHGAKVGSEGVLCLEAHA